MGSGQLPKRCTKMSPKLSPKPAQKWPENGPEIDPFWRAGKQQNALFSLCFRLKRAPEGDPKRAQNGAQMSPENIQNWHCPEARQHVRGRPEAGCVFSPTVVFFRPGEKNKRTWAYYFPEARQHVQGWPEANRFFSPTWGIRFRPGEKNRLIYGELLIF